MALFLTIIMPVWLPAGIPAKHAQAGIIVKSKAGKGKTVKITAKAADGTGKKAAIKIKIK